MRSVLILLLACQEGIGGNKLSGDGASDGEEFDEGSDQVAPTIVFDPFTDNQPSGTDVVVEAYITDDETGVFMATLYFRNETDSSKDWSSVGFTVQGDELWTATIKADEQRSGGMWYYLLAVDMAQNSATSPDRGDEEPYHFGYSD
ncbi:MAG: hypothetical protein FJ090_10165 [Deltaproteobacteria bacterium]|nr:hypothetical protein [Deltaproteobacteria bacterium]